MPRVRVRKRVPVFSKHALDLADVCCRELWRGRRYYDDTLQTSEEELLRRLSIPFLSDSLGIDRGNYQDITVDTVKSFIIVAGLKQMNITQSNRDDVKGIETIKKIISSRLRKSLRNVYATNFHELTLELTDELSKAFHKLSKTGSTKAACIPLATRLLFFTAPNLPVFMYSDDLGEALKVNKTNKTEGLSEFYESMRLGLEANWQILREYQMPFLTDKITADEAWLEARENGWWQRRILDLACVINFTEVKPKDFLISLTEDYPKQHP